MNEDLFCEFLEETFDGNIVRERWDMGGHLELKTLSSVRIYNERQEIVHV